MRRLPALIAVLMLMLAGCSAGNNASTQPAASERW